MQETHAAPIELSSDTAVEVLQEDSSYSVSQHAEKQVNVAVDGVVPSDCGQDQQAALASQHADLATPAVAEQPLAVLAVCVEQPCSHDADQHAEQSTDQLSCSGSRTDANAMQESATSSRQKSQNADKLPRRQDNLRSASTASSRQCISSDASKITDQSIAISGLASSASCEAMNISSHESTLGEDANAQQPAVEAYVGTSPGLAAEMLHHQQAHVSEGMTDSADTCGSSRQDSMVVSLSSQQVPAADDGMSACRLFADACTSKSTGSVTSSASSQQDNGAVDHQQENGAAEHQQDKITADHQQHCSTACVSNPESSEVHCGSTEQAQMENITSSQSCLASCTSSPQSLGAGGIGQASCQENGMSGDQPAEACSGCTYMPPAEKASSQQSRIDTNSASQQLSTETLTSMAHSSTVDSRVRQCIHADEGLPDDQSSAEADASATASCTAEALSSQQSCAAEETGSHADLQTACKQPVTAAHQVSAASSACQSTAAGQTSEQPCNSQLHGGQARAAGSTHAAISQPGAPQAVQPASASHAPASTPQLLGAQQDRQQLSSQFHVDSGNAAIQQAEQRAVTQHLTSAQATPVHRQQCHSSQAVDGCIAAQSVYAQAADRVATQGVLSEAQTEQLLQQSAPVTSQSTAADAEAANRQRGQQQPSVAAHVQEPQDAKVPRSDVRWSQQHVAGQHRSADAVDGFAIAMHHSDIPHRLHAGEKLPAEYDVCL